MTAAVLTGMPARLRDWMSRGHRPASGDASTATSPPPLPVAAGVFVVAVVAAGFAVLILQGPRQMQHPAQFAVLLAASVVASSLRLRLSLGTSASKPSISSHGDF